MIAANELRVGNLIEHNGMIENVVSLNANGKINNNPYKVYNPIIITDEWLQKCGFITKNDEINQFQQDIDHLYCIDYFYVAEVHGKFYIFDYVPGDSYYSSTSLEIFTLHQLQNLFFVLTGKELEINIPL